MLEQLKPGLVVEAGRERRVFYTSDTSLRAQAIQPGADYPALPVDTVLLESTLGADPDAELTSRRDQEEAFAEARRRDVQRGPDEYRPRLAAVGDFQFRSAPCR